MTSSTKSTKDTWDKLDVASKLISGLVLAVIAVIAKTGADDIANSLHRGQLVQALIGDLTTPGGNTRQDIALIALDAALGEQDPKMMCQIAEQVILQRKELTNPLGTIAFRIIKRRDPKMAADLSNKAAKRVDEPRSALISDASISQTPAAQPVEQRKAPEESQLIAAVYPTIVYIQFRKELNRALAENLRKRLTDRGLFAPGVQKVDARYENSVRFFHAEDLDLARKVAEYAEAYRKEQNLTGEFKVRDFSRSGFKTQRGQVEIWFNPEK
jgi:hypothetical protein